MKRISFFYQKSVGEKSTQIDFNVNRKERQMEGFENDLIEKKTNICMCLSK
jgi:hypothetical protein